MKKLIEQLEAEIAELEKQIVPLWKAYKEGSVIESENLHAWDRVNTALEKAKLKLQLAKEMEAESGH